MVREPLPGDPIGDQDLEALEALADAWAQDHGGMPLEALDGLFCALVVGPGPPAGPSEYLDMAVGDVHAWEDDAEASTAFGLLVRLWNHIVWRVGQPLPDHDDESEEAFEHVVALVPFIGLPEPEHADGRPAGDGGVLDGVPDDFPVGALWASGFLQGMALRKDDWGRWLAADQDLAEDIVDLSRLSLVAREQAEEVGLDWNERLDLDQRWGLVMSLPALLQDLNDARMAEMAAPVPVRRDPMPGRNDPCPCGSGRKWKKCCGSSVH